MLRKYWVLKTALTRNNIVFKIGKDFVDNIIDIHEGYVVALNTPLDEYQMNGYHGDRIARPITRKIYLGIKRAISYPDQSYREFLLKPVYKDLTKLIKKVWLVLILKI